MVTRLVSYQFWFKNIVMKYSRKHLREFPLNGPEERIAVPIAGDGAIATGGIGYGRLIPLLILDTTNRPDLNEAIRIQSSVPSGDVEVSWGNIFTNPKYVLKNHKHITLFICFKQYHQRYGQTRHPAGESRNPHLRVDDRLKLEFHGSKVIRRGLSPTGSRRPDRGSFPRQPYRQERAAWHGRASPFMAAWWLR